MKRLAGPAILGVLALSFILGSLFKPFGLGGKGAGEGESEVATKTDEPKTDDPSLPPENVSSNVTTPPPMDGIQPSEYPHPLIISISEYQYVVQTSEKTTKIIPLDQLIMLIENAPADKSGVKAKVSRFANAQAKAEEDFKQLLDKAEIEPNAVIWEPDLIPETVQ